MLLAYCFPLDLNEKFKANLIFFKCQLVVLVIKNKKLFKVSATKACITGRYVY